MQYQVKVVYLLNYLFYQNKLLLKVFLQEKNYQILLVYNLYLLIQLQNYQHMNYLNIIHFFNLFFFTEYSVTTWFDYSYLVKYFFSKLSIRNTAFSPILTCISFHNLILYLVSNHKDFWIYFDPIRSTVLLTFFCKTYCS